MTRRAILCCCLACAAAAFLVGAVTGALVAANDKEPWPPAGQQFDDGPVLVRMPSAGASKVRFIF